MKVTPLTNHARGVSRTYFGVLLACSLVPASQLATNAAHAEPIHSHLTKKHLVTVEGYRQQSKASLTAARRNFEPTPVEVRDNTWLAGYRYRHNARWQYSLTYYRYRYSADKTAETTFNFDNVDIQVGAALNSSLTIDTYAFDAMYTLHRTDRSELTVGGGFYVLDNDVVINSQRTVNYNDQEEVDQGRGRASVTAPLPKLQGSYFHAFTPKLSITATAGWLVLSYKEYNEAFRYLRFKAEYLITDALGLNAGFQFASIDAQDNLGRGYVRFDVEFSGVAVGVSYAF